MDVGDVVKIISKAVNCIRAEVAEGVGASASVPVPASSPRLSEIAGRVFNVGGPRGLSRLELARIVASGVRVFRCNGVRV